MRKFTFFVFCNALISLASAQSIQLKFTGLFSGAHVNLDSVRITDLTHPGDTVIYWPDTSLFLPYTSIGDINRSRNSGFSVQLVSSNPVASQASIRVFLPESSAIDVRITDALGRILQKINPDLQAGEHEFTYSPGKQGVSIVSIDYKGELISLKIVCNGNEFGRNTLEYHGLINMDPHTKSTFSTQTFNYYLLDNLKFRGWYNGLNSVIYSAQVNSTFTFTFVIDPCQGVTQLTYGGQVYHTILIGSQCWLKENLNIGTMINGSASQTNNSIIEKYCFNNDSSNCIAYGGLYLWAEMMQYTTFQGIQGICPSGWHIPTDVEWGNLVYYLGGYQVAGGKMKETGFAHWQSPNSGADNISGFTALGGGIRNYLGGFYDLKYSCYFWSSSEESGIRAWDRNLDYDNSYIYDGYDFKTSGYSVRCSKN